MATGSVKFYNENKGFGFIKSSAGGPDLFFHVSNVIGGEPLSQDDEVGFETTESSKGPAAVKVELLKASEY